MVLFLTTWQLWAALLARGADGGALAQVSNEQLDAALQLGVCAGQSYLVTVCACQLVKRFIDDGLGVWQPPSSELFDQVCACDVAMTVFAVDSHR